MKRCMACKSTMSWHSPISQHTLLTAVNFATNLLMISSKFGVSVSCSNEQLRIIAGKDESCVRY